MTLVKDMIKDGCEIKVVNVPRLNNQIRMSVSTSDVPENEIKCGFLTIKGNFFFKTNTSVWVVAHRSHGTLQVYQEKVLFVSFSVINYYINRIR